MDSQRQVCTTTVESVDHVLRFCPIALAVWSLLIKEDRFAAFLKFEFREWIGMNIMGGADFVKNRLDWDFMFRAVIWNLWKLRNEMVFGSDELYEGSMLEMSKHLFGIMQHALTKTTGAS
ncbi:hypothetical protein V6N13_106693 [Hibiscus sabdariffa]